MIIAVICWMVLVILYCYWVNRAIELNKNNNRLKAEAKLARESMVECPEVKIDIHV